MSANCKLNLWSKVQSMLSPLITQPFITSIRLCIKKRSPPSVHSTEYFLYPCDIKAVIMFRILILPPWRHYSTISTLIRASHPAAASLNFVSLAPFSHTSFICSFLLFYELLYYAYWKSTVLLFLTPKHDLNTEFFRFQGWTCLWTSLATTWQHWQSVESCTRWGML